MQDWARTESACVGAGGEWHPPTPARIKLCALGVPTLNNSRSLHVYPVSYRASFPSRNPSRRAREGRATTLLRVTGFPELAHGRAAMPAPHACPEGTKA